MSYFKYLLTAIIINLSPVLMMSQNIKMDFDGYIDSSPRIDLSISFEINTSNIERGQYATAKNCRVIYHNAEGTYGTPSGYFQGGQLFFDLNLPYRLIAEGYNVIVFDKVPENLQQVKEMRGYLHKSEGVNNPHHLAVVLKNTNPISEPSNAKEEEMRTQISSSRAKEKDLNARETQHEILEKGNSESVLLGDEIEAGVQDQIEESDYIDLGLPSGSLWGCTSEGKLYDYESANRVFGRNLPTIEEFEELMQYCTWTWSGNGYYKVVGRNGNSIVLPAEGWRNEHGSVTLVGSDGGYWSSTSDGLNKAFYLNFNSTTVRKQSYLQSCGLSVCLIERDSECDPTMIGSEEELFSEMSEDSFGDDSEVQRSRGVAEPISAKAASGISEEGKVAEKKKKVKKGYEIEIILAIIIVLGVIVKRLYFNIILPGKHKCSHCGKQNAMMILDEDYETQMGGYIKISQTRECKYCGYTETILINRGHNIFS